VAICGGVINNHATSNPAISDKKGKNRIKTETLFSVYIPDYIVEA